MKRLRVVARGERGIATVMALMAMVLMSALGLALVLNSSTELLVAANFQNAQEALHGADGAIERAITDVRDAADWDRILGGLDRSAFVDGAASGTRTLADGSVVNLSQILSMANCRKTTACSSTDLVATTAARPWGANNPVWQLYAYGPLSGLLPGGTVNSPFYAVVLAADDPSENDGDPLHDGPAPGNPGSGILLLHAETFGPRGTHKVVEVTVARGATPSSLHTLSWREIR